MTTRLPSPLVMAGFAAVICSCAPARAGAEEDGLAIKMLRRDAYPAARLRFVNLSHASPDDAWVWAGLALAACRLERTSEAAEALARARSLDDDEPLVLVARSCMAEGDPEDAGAAEDLLRRASSASPEFFYYQRWAHRLMDEGRYGEALAAIEEGMTAGWSGNLCSLMRAECLIATGRLEEATAGLQEVRVASPRLSPGLAQEALLALAAGRLSGAAVAPYAQLPRFASAVKSTLVRAEAIRRLGRLDDAEWEVNRCRSDPSQPVGWAAIARVRGQLGDRDGAREALNEGTRRWPTHPSLTLTEALLCAWDGDLAGARRALDAARAWGIPAWDRAVVDEIEDLMSR